MLQYLVFVGNSFNLLGYYQRTGCCHYFRYYQRWFCGNTDSGKVVEASGNRNPGSVRGGHFYYPDELCCRQNLELFVSRFPGVSGAYQYSYYFCDLERKIYKKE